jgi:leucyl aminopeptidase (aminopeptidase T)
LWQTISAHGRNGLNVAEFGIGINPRAKITGNVLEDEKVLGTIHIAFGDNSGFGGRIKVPSHQDGIVKNPDVWLDGKQLMKNGKLLI